MDQAWALEKEFWDASTSGDVAAYYARVLTADAFVVVPGDVLDRDRLMLLWDSRAPFESYELTQSRVVLVNGETVVLSYRVDAKDPAGEVYRARVSSVYVWSGGGWALAMRQHTPEPDSSAS
jgi:hypothetical protein